MVKQLANSPHSHGLRQGLKCMYQRKPRRLDTAQAVPKMVVAPKNGARVTILVGI